LQNYRLKEIQVARESPASQLGEPAGGLWPPADKVLRYAHVPFLFELLQMDAEISVGHRQLIAKLGESQAFDGRQDRHDGQPASFVQDCIEFFQNALQCIHGDFSLM